MKRLITFLIIGMLSITLVNNPLTDGYVSGLKVINIPVSGQKNALFMEIEEVAKEYEKPAQDAKIDPVWKAIPGYNGLKVDISASYAKMKKDGKFDAAKLVYIQTTPAVHLKDLPPTAIYKGHPDKPMVSFIINVAWGNEYLGPILETLKKNNVHASFFLEGRWVKENPELAKMIVEAGHEVGNHSYTHPDMKQISSAKIREEIVKTNEVIKATTGEEVVWLAPPSGSYREEVVKIASEYKLGTVMWSVDTIDWQKPTPQQLINRVMGKVHKGAMILMHPTDSTAKALDELIKRIKVEKYEINTVSELLSEERIMKKSVLNEQE
ncbi:polysaccharide deacetylase family protein [Robertmurraya korlensis]|uniref:polysaccharide deacetylase family protein n=1 Tax=Robertmurraya korlensis TaxID=519977 RepID=UPI00203D00D7|nr:polysaccharide deacetylase family protein [Robertmurraya korlensis]MCM3600141.1 polysaccharide deacetylase family protein [Robertmurraya korlensis]